MSDIEHGDDAEEPMDYSPIGAGAAEALERLRRAVDAWDATLSSYCDGPERDEVRAASLVASRFEGR